eukprot:GFYU01005913.1.p1 GENE.GFYU01005913.1~~GFYU01005913.1.p1  ORF type:complete len:579 (-),score=167.83 GFYU01005913.1:142-1878(-)
MGGCSSTPHNSQRVHGPSSTMGDSKKDDSNIGSTDELATLRAALAEAKAQNKSLILELQGEREKRKALEKQFGEAKVGEKKTLHILHFNDIYNLDAKDPQKYSHCGGATRFATLLRDQMKQHPQALITFSGDFIGPSLMSCVTKGRHMVEALNLLDVHYGCLGNHEFDFGLPHLHKMIHGYDTKQGARYAGSQCQFVMSNMFEGDGKTPLGKLTEYELVDWFGVKVGIIGLCENWLPHCARLTPEDNASYKDIYQVGESLADKLKSEGAEIVIALTHNRLEEDYNVTLNCPSIDLLLGGHDHFYKQDLPKRVIKSGQEFQWLSHITVKINTKGAGGKPEVVSLKNNMLTVDSATPEDIEMKLLVDKYADIKRKKMDKVIGKSTVPLDSTEEACRFKESGLCTFANSLMRDYLKADLVILAGATFGGKELKPPGDITVGDLFKWFPRETSCIVVDATGQQILELLEAGVKSLPGEAPGFPQISDNVKYEVCVANKPENRIDNVYISGHQLDPTKLYKVGMSAFMGKGKATPLWTKDANRITNEEHAPLFTDVLRMHFKVDKQNPDFKVVTTTADHITVM